MTTFLGAVMTLRLLPGRHYSNACPSDQWVRANYLAGKNLQGTEDIPETALCMEMNKPLHVPRSVACQKLVGIGNDKFWPIVLKNSKLRESRISAKPHFFQKCDPSIVHEAMWASLPNT